MIIGSKSDRSRRIALLGGGSVLLALLVFALWQFVLRTPYVTAFSGVARGDAVTIAAQLDKLKIPYRLADDGREIRVPQDRLDMARMQVLGGELALKNTVGFELFNKSDMGLTDFAQRINYQRALQGELARTIMGLAEIESARVHLTLPERSLFRSMREPVKASVALVVKPGMVMQVDAVAGVQRLVASAVEGLDAANVSVLDDRGRALTAAAYAEDVTPDIQEQRGLADYYAGRVRSALEAAGLPTPARVQVRALTPADGANTAAGLGAVRPPLDVALIFELQPEAETDARLVATAREALGPPADPADRVAVRIGTLQSNLAAPQPRAAMGGVSSNSVAEAKTVDSTVAIWAGGLVLLLGGAALVAMRRKGARLVDMDDDAGFVRHLTDLIDNEKSDA
ncbi:MAG: flagellar M-ring protein FliF [Proteobacteria bacterium]|nr:flagellar M-ring protein FliF [Pseudomonadota bacterium]